MSGLEKGGEVAAGVAKRIHVPFFSAGLVPPTITVSLKPIAQRAVLQGSLYDGGPETQRGESAMSYKREFINVRVSRRVLWVGAEAYPLQNIARAQTIKIVPKRGAAVGRYIAAVVLWVILGIVAAAAISSAMRFGYNYQSTSGVVVIVVLVLIVISTIRLIRVLSRRTLYALVIETAGTPYTALVSADGNMVTRLVHLIMDAIDNPQAEFQLQVENFHVGDKIQQFGNQNVGKVSR